MHKVADDLDLILWLTLSSRSEVLLPSSLAATFLGVPVAVVDECWPYHRRVLCKYRD